MIQNEKVITGGNTTRATNAYTFCANRLPCGFCRLRELNGKAYEPVFRLTLNDSHEVTCKAEVQE